MASEGIPTPLWDLMLSTNDCSPGCGCELDFFDLNVSRITAWVEKAKKEDIKLALKQSQEFAKTVAQSGWHQDFASQTNIIFVGGNSDAQSWSREWFEILNKCVTNGAA